MPSTEIALVLASATAMAPVAELPYRLGYDSVFLVFFITLGPVKAIGDYFLATQGLAQREVVALGLKVFGLSTITILVAGLMGSMMLHKWHISTSVMQLVAGIIFFVVAIRLVFAQYADPPNELAPVPPMKSSTMHLVFPATVTPYGLAALITIMALSQDSGRSASLMGLAVAVMVINVLAMLSIRFIMRWIGPIPLKVLSAVLGILQVALAMQLIVGTLAQMARPG